MNYRDYEYPSKKFRTLHRDDMYHVIEENDRVKMFSRVVDTFMMAFAIGFHLNGRKHVTGSDAINHTNMSYISVDNQDLIILLMLNRHPEIETASELWSMVEDYAEFGIEVLFESLRRSDWVLDMDDVFNNMN